MKIYGGLYISCNSFRVLFPELGENVYIFLILNFDYLYLMTVVLTAINGVG